MRGAERKAKFHYYPCLCRWLRGMLNADSQGPQSREKAGVSSRNGQLSLTLLIFCFFIGVLSWIDVLGISCVWLYSACLSSQYKSCFLGVLNLNLIGFAGALWSFEDLPWGCEDSQRLLQQEPGAGSPGKVELWLVGSKQAGFWLDTCSWLQFRLGFSTGSLGKQKHLWELSWWHWHFLAQLSQFYLNLHMAD